MESTQQDTEITLIDQNINEIKDIRQLPKDLHPYFSLDIIKDSTITVSEKQSLVKTYGKDAKSWVAPKTEIQRKFAIDSIIFQLYEEA